MRNKKVIFRDLGSIDYQEAWDYQERLLQEIVQLKIENRKKSESDKRATPNYLLFCEHPHVFTLGKSGDDANLLVNDEQLNQIEAKFVQTNRGGDITYHGPGQIVVYPIFDLDNFFTDIHKYLRFLEQAVMDILAQYGIESGRIEKLTGVWLGIGTYNPRKICAIGVRTSRWVTMHGLALNVNSNLDYFNQIVPCGINDKAVTSISKELNRAIEIEEVKQNLLQNLAKLFEFELAD